MPSVSPEHKPGVTSGGAEQRSLKVVLSSGEVGMMAEEVPQISIMEDRQEGVVAVGEEETRLALGGGGKVGEVSPLSEIEREGEEEREGGSEGGRDIHMYMYM